jgi:hypothetical protein
MKKAGDIAKHFGIFIAWLVGVVSYILLMIWVGFVAFQHWLIHATKSYWYCGSSNVLSGPHTKWVRCYPTYYQANYVHIGLIITVICEVLFTIAMLFVVFGEFD